MSSSTTFNERVNALAQQYAQTKNEYFLTDLVNEMLPICKRDAKNWSRRSPLTEEDLLSTYVEAVQLAAEEYVPTRHFIKRYHFFKNRRGAELYKHGKAEKRNGEKKLVSLDKNVTETQEDDLTLSNQIACHESDFDQVVALQDMMARFKEQQPIYGEIIEMCAQQEPKIKIARFLGEETYGETSRKKVSLARKAFRKFIK